MIRFADPLFLLLCLLIPVLIYAFKRTERMRESSFRFSKVSFISGARPSFRMKLEHSLIYLRAIAVFLVILAFARPQSSLEGTKINIKGIDIVLVMDTSTSMMAMDFKMDGKRVNRLDVVKDVVRNFINKRPNDRIGLVAFSALAYTICPLTLDHDWLEKNMDRVKIGMIKDGTAIGSAITAALNRLKDSKTKQKIIILLTDGRNNSGRVSPPTAAETAKALGVRIYTIGAGTRGLAPYPFKDMFGNTVIKKIQIDIDDDLLKKIAETTGGEYFRATDTGSLKKIYDEINKLEKTPMEEIGYSIYNELFYIFLLPALLLFLAEILLTGTVLRRIP